MSRFREDSELTQLSRRGSEATEGVSRMLVRALCAADRARRITSGRFEPRVVAALERIGYMGAPQGTTRERRSGPISTRVLIRSGRRGSIALPDPVDLGGIGKGLALRWAAAAIDRVLAAGGDQTNGRGYLLEAGGDIVLDGEPGAGEPWLLGIEDAAGGPTPAAVLKASGRFAVATSSTRRLHWQREGREVHHLIDPRTGEPGDGGLTAVTVAGPDPAWAEVWSKALFLDGAAGIATLARSRGLAAWWTTEDGRFEMTAAARSRTTWVAGET